MLAVSNDSGSGRHTVPLWEGLPVCSMHHEAGWCLGRVDESALCSD